MIQKIQIEPAKVSADIVNCKKATFLCSYAVSLNATDWYFFVEVCIECDKMHIVLYESVKNLPYFIGIYTLSISGVCEEEIWSLIFINIVSSLAIKLYNWHAFTVNRFSIRSIIILWESYKPHIRIDSITIVNLVRSALFILISFLTLFWFGLTPFWHLPQLHQCYFSWKYLKKI